MHIHQPHLPYIILTTMSVQVHSRTICQRNCSTWWHQMWNYRGNGTQGCSVLQNEHHQMEPSAIQLLTRVQSQSRHYNGCSSVLWGLYLTKYGGWGWGVVSCGLSYSNHSGRVGKYSYVKAFLIFGTLTVWYQTIMVLMTRDTANVIIIHPA